MGQAGNAAKPVENIIPRGTRPINSMFFKTKSQTLINTGSVNIYNIYSISYKDLEGDSQSKVLKPLYYGSNDYTFFNANLVSTFDSVRFRLAERVPIGKNLSKLRKQS